MRHASKQTDKATDSCMYMPPLSIDAGAYKGHINHCKHIVSEGKLLDLSEPRAFAVSKLNMVRLFLEQ